MAKKKEAEKTMALINGELVEVEHTITPQEVQSNEPLDRSRITKETKADLAKLLKKLPEIKPVIEILIGSEATKELE
jgi:hypothetical protein